MNIINLIGLVLNIVGTVIVSISGGGLLRSFHTSLMATETTLAAYLSNQRDIPLFTGLDSTREKQMNAGQKWLTFGLIIVVLGFILQVAALAPSVIAEIKTY
jgi:hypothetical protein